MALLARSPSLGSASIGVRVRVVTHARGHTAHVALDAQQLCLTAIAAAAVCCVAAKAARQRLGRGMGGGNGNRGRGGPGGPGDVAGGWGSGARGAPAAMRGEANDYCQYFVDTGLRPQNNLRDVHLVRPAGAAGKESA